MGAFYIVLGHVLWFFLYSVVLKIGLYITDRTHKSSMKRWGTDLDDYSYNRMKLKLYVSLYFIGIPILFWIGFVMYYRNGYL